MARFTLIENSSALLYSRGVTKEAPLFTLNDHIYAKHGSGYIRLRAKGGTSLVNVRWDDVYVGDGSYVESTFNLHFVAPTPKKKSSRKPSLVAAE